ncbi:MAG: hypothetical protein VW602_01575, partial [Paracoccaceae bacterium]
MSIAYDGTNYVQLGSQLSANVPTSFTIPVNDGDVIDHGAATTFSRTIADGDSTVPHKAGDTQTYKPHGDTDES